MSPGESRLRSIAVQAVLAALAAVCGLAFAPAFGGRLTAADFAPGGLTLTVVVAAVVPAVVVTTCALLRREPLLAAAVGLAATVLAVLLVARPGADVFSGGYRLLTSALPAVADGPARATVGALTGFAALAAALLAAYARLRALALVPPLAALLAALALDAGIGAPPPGYAALVVALVGAALALVREPVGGAAGTGTASPGRIVRRALPLVGAAVVLAAAALLTGTGLDHLPGVRGNPADARDLVAAPIRPRSAVSPMLEFPAFADGTLALRLTGTSSRRLDRLTLVTLDRFTGPGWTTAANYRRAGRTLAADPNPARTIRLTVHAPRPGPLSWLLRPDHPVRVDGAAVGIDESSGDLTVPAGSPYPRRYQIAGTAAIRPTARLRNEPAAPRSGPVVSDRRPVPHSIAAFADTARTAATPYLQLSALQNQLRGEDFLLGSGRSAPAGSGLFQIDALLSGPGRHIGTSEQYASAFAVLARELGYDSRLVIGFRPRYGADGRSFTVTGQDVHAWVQVRFARTGWVTFDPTPTRRADRTAPARAQPAPAARPNPAPTRSSAPPTAHTAHPSPLAGADDGGSRTDATLAVGLAAVVAALLLAAPPTAKAARRRRRRRGAVPAHAVAGAWQESLDRLVEAGAPTGRGRSSGEVTAAAPAAVRPQVGALGSIVDRAGYAPEAAGPDDARTAWRHADAVARTLRQGHSPLRRVVAALDPRPLWR